MFSNSTFSNFATHLAGLDNHREHIARFNAAVDDGLELVIKGVEEIPYQTGAPVAIQPPASSGRS
jgi:hypothetical protein